MKLSPTLALFVASLLPWGMALHGGPVAPTLAFDPPETFLLGHVSEPIQLGDLNSDGHLDAVISNTGNDGEPGLDKISVLVGGTSGTLTRGGDFEAGDRPEGITLGDFNHDGTLDVAAADFAGGTVAVLIGDGAGGFAAPVYTAVAGGPRWVVSADWNGDGVADVATSNYDGATVSILLGLGTGGFLTLETDPVGNGAEVVAMGQLNADAAPDLVTSNAIDGTVTPLLNSGTGRFTPGVAHAVGERPRFIATRDLDGDGLSDLIVANHFASSVSIEKALGDGTFETSKALSFQTPDIFFERPVYIALADVSGDGVDDVLATWSRSDVFTVFPRSAASFEFGPPSAFATGHTPVGIAAADLDQDGGVDVIVSNAVDGSAAVYRSYRGREGIIADDGSPGTSAVGPWSASDAPFAYGGGSLFARDGARYSWEAPLPEPGLYELMLWWTVTTSRSDAAWIEIAHASGVTSVRANQQEGIGLWHSLGVYRFDATAGVTLNAPPGEPSASADAVRLVPRKDLTEAPARGTVSVALDARPATLDAGGERTIIAFHGSWSVAEASEGETWTAAVVAPAGEGEESASIAACRLHADSNGNGVFDEGDRQLGEALRFGSDIRVITFQGFEENVPTGATGGFFIICELAPEATGDLQLELTAFATRGGVTRTPSIVTGLPLKGWLFPVPESMQRPGDGNQDARLDISDAVFLLNYLFRGTVARLPCGGGGTADPANVRLLDSNGDAGVDITDSIRVLTFLFGGADPPVLGQSCVPIPGCPDNSVKCAR